MFRALFSHTWREMVRSVIWKRSLGAFIFWGILITLLALNMLSFGLLFDRTLAEIYPDRDPIQLINGILLYYLVPVVVKAMVPAVSPSTAGSWITGVFMLMLGNSLLHLYLDRQSALNPGRKIPSYWFNSGMVIKF